MPVRSSKASSFVARACVAFSLAVLACACSSGAESAPPPESGPPSAGDDRLSGNVDVRPYRAYVAFARRRDDNGRLDIKAFDRPVGPDIGCLSGEQGLVDTQRTVLIQMPWPVPVGSVWTSGVHADSANTAGVSFWVRRGLGGSAQGAAGTVTVRAVDAKGGVLFLDAATANRTGGVHGSVRGELPFTICE